jgi:diguanylate cyclase (GGDEF)-like protein
LLRRDIKKYTLIVHWVFIASFFLFGHAVLFLEDPLTIVWFYIGQLLLFTLGGKREGILYTIASLVFNILVMKLYQVGVSDITVLTFILSTIFVGIIAHEANSKIESTQVALSEKNKKLEQLAITDKLTGLYNRNKLDEFLQNEIDRSERFSYSLGFVILDIDYFKQVNDTYGHIVGDKVLIEFASIMTKCTRKTDIVGRWGGEEFVIIFPVSDKDFVIKKSEKIKKKIESYSFYEVGKKTASFGICMFTKGDTIESLSKKADDALYEAKNGGRNKIVVHHNI